MEGRSADLAAEGGDDKDLLSAELVVKRNEDEEESPPTGPQKEEVLVEIILSHAQSPAWRRRTSAPWLGREGRGKDADQPRPIDH